jgi:thioredoxin reductase (NADPH)
MLTVDDVRSIPLFASLAQPELSSVPAVFACGDVRLSPVKRVASAVGEGSMAIAFVHKVLQESGARARDRARGPAAPSARRRRI